MNSACPGVITGLVMAFLLAPANGEAQAPQTDRAVLERNKDLAVQFFELEDKLDIAGLRRIIREDYVQHLPSAPDYREPLLAIFEGWKANGLTPRHEIVRVLAERDHVWVYARQLGPDGTGRARMDMFRVQDGLLAEHWEIGESIDAERRNANDNFAVGRGPQDASEQPVRVAKVVPPDVLERNKDVARQFYHYFDGRDTAGLRRIMREDYIQHNAGIEDGREGLLKGIDAARAATRSRGESNQIIRTIAEGDYVWVFIRDNNGARAQLNQFRIENGQLAEHWELYQDVPEERMHDKDFFGSGRGASIDFTR